MKRFNIVWYILIIIILPIAIILISGNAVLRVPATYTYHFNDIQAAEEVGSSITGNEFADAITGYFNSPGRDEFQVYEVNGEFQDPIFEEDESTAMFKAKTLLLWTLFTGIILLGLSIALYLYMNGNVEREKLRIVGFIVAIVTVLELLAVVILVRRASFRSMIYDKFIGVDLGKDSTLRILLGTPFEKSYLIFSSVLAVVLIGVFLYIHHNVTRERRLFS